MTNQKIHLCGFVIIATMLSVIGCGTKSSQKTQLTSVADDTTVLQVDTLTIVEEDSLKSIYESSIFDSDWEFIEQLQKAIQTNDRKWVVRHIRYPLPQEYPIRDISNEDDMLKSYNWAFPEPLRKQVVSSLRSDWDRVGWRGVMLTPGYFWFDEFNEGILIRSICSDSKKQITNLISEERKILGENNLNFVPELCYISHDSSILVHVGKDTTFAYAYPDPGYTIRFFKRGDPLKEPKYKASAKHYIEGSCGNDLYVGRQGNMLIYVWDYYCGGYADLKGNDFGCQLSEVDNSPMSDEEMYVVRTDNSIQYVMERCYLRDVASWW